MMVHVAAIAMQTPLAGEQGAGPICDRAWLAQRRPAFGARQAMPAARDEHHDDMIADLEIVHAGPEFLHDAGRFVTQHHRRRPRPVSIDDGQIGVAQASRSDLHHHFAVSGIIKLELLDAERLRFVVWRLGAQFVEHCGFDFHGHGPG